MTRIAFVFAAPLLALIAPCLAAAPAAAGETWDVVVVGGTERAVESAVAAKRAGAKTLLVAPRPFLGDDVSGRLRLDVAPSPSCDKFRLHGLVISNGVPLRTGTAVTRAVGGSDSPYLLETWDRGGRGEIAARAVVDATGEPYLSERQGVRFAPFKPGRHRFCRMVLNGERPSAPGLSVEDLGKSYPVAIPERDIPAPAGFPSVFTARLYRCTAEIEIADDSPLSLAKAEASFRDMTFGPLQADSGERSWMPEPPRPLLEGGAEGAAKRGWFWCEGESARAVASAAADFAAKHPSVNSERGDVIDAEDEWPVLAEVDVAVAGGGTCGAPAAIAAARAGAKTLVCEFYFNLGGSQTTGLIGKYFHGNRVGFTREIDGGVAKTGAILNQAKAEYYRREIAKSGGVVLYGSRAVGVAFAGRDGIGRRAVAGLRVVTADGRKGIVRAKVTVDATGNADVAAAAGAPVAFGSGCAEAPILQGTSISWRNLGTSISNLEVTLTDDTDAESIRRGLLQTLMTYGTHYWDVMPFVGTRERRHIVGDFTVRTCDLERGKRYRDTVTVCLAGQDSHGVFSDEMLYFTTMSGRERLLRAPVPYRAMFPKGLSGLLVTGLGISAERGALAVMRMQADLQNEGYAAGRAAAMAAAAGVAPDAIDVRLLQRHLVEKGIIPAETLDDVDTPSLGEAHLRALVPAVCAATNENLNGICEFFAAEDAGRKVLESLAVRPPFAAGTREAVHFALLASSMGVWGCEGELVRWLRADGTNFWDRGYASDMHFGPRFSLRDEAIVALARMRYAPFGADLARMVRALPDDAAFSHLRAVAIYLDAVPVKECAPELKRLLAASRTEAQACTDSSMPEFRSVRIHPQLRELMLARSLYRLGDSGDYARGVLEGYLNDPVKVFADFARRALAGYWDDAAKVREGVLLKELDLTVPRLMKAFMMRVDLKTPGLGFTATERDPDWGKRMPDYTNGIIRTRRERTVDFMRRRRAEGRNVEVAVNVAPWTPWCPPWNHKYADPGCWIVSDGVEVSPGREPGKGSLFVIYSDSSAEITAKVADERRSDVRFAMCGFSIIAADGKPVAEHRRGHRNHPRTAFGLSADRRYLFLLVVDGRQKGYSLGCDERDLCDILIPAGAADAVNMDGGGSTSLVIWDEAKKRPKMLNHQPFGTMRTVSVNFGLTFPH